MLPGPSRFAFQSRPNGSTRLHSSSTCVLVEAKHADHAASGCHGGGLHRLPAQPHQLEPGFEFDRTRKDERRVFAQREPGGALARRHDVGIGRFQAFERRQAGDKKGWLADVGRVQRLGRPLEAEPRQVDAENFAGAVEEGSRRRQLGVELTPHADGLSPWPGNKKAILGIGAFSSRVAL